MSKKQWESYFDAIKNQNWEKALDSLNSVLKNEPKNPQVHLKIGDVFQKAGDMSNAVAAYHQSAWLLMKEGFLQKALAIFKIILRLDPNNAEAINKSKELLMELESSKMKSALVIPSLETKIEVSEQEVAAEFEPSAGAKFELETEQKAEIEPPAKIEDFLERTSYAEEPLKAKTPVEIPGQAEIGIQPETGVSEIRRGEEEPVLYIPFLESLPKNEIKQLVGRIEPQSFLPGQMIVEEGDSGDSIFVIKSGNAKVVAHILGKEIELATLSAGDVFGEVAFLTGRPRTASVIATDNLKIIEFNRLLLEEIFDKYPDILRKLEDFYQSHVQDTLQKVKTKIKK